MIERESRERERERERERTRTERIDKARVKIIINRELGFERKED